MPDFSRGACRNKNPDLFVGADTDTSLGAELHRISRAKQICRGCPIMMQCRWFAWDSRSLGVWGGVNHTYKTHGAYRKSRTEYDRQKAAHEEAVTKWVLEVIGDAVAQAITSELRAPQGATCVRPDRDRSA
jgi:WhiB family redox-sensing transcriptional regulator